MRVRKDPEIRRAELIDAALDLFISLGYEKTMVADIGKKAGVAKGTFFYYFSTKEAILEAICTRYALELVSSFKWKSRHSSAINKLQIFITQLFQPSPIDALYDTLSSENQISLLEKLWKHQLEMVFNVVLRDIILQGNNEKSMDVSCINETIPFFWSTLECLWEAVYYKEASDTLSQKVCITSLILERILGIKEGVLILAII